MMIKNMVNKPVEILSPVTKREKQKARLENWTYYPQGGGFRDSCHLEGYVYDHPNQWNCPDGEFISTSPVLWIDLSIGIAETQNTVYILEGPQAK